MKLKYLFSIVLSSALLFAGCNKEDSVGPLDNISLSKTYVAIPEAGGEVTVTLSATEDWAFVLTEKDKDGKDEAQIPDWLKITPTSGSEGETTLTFKADAVSGGREVALKITAGVNTQQVIVRQGSLEAETATVAEVLAGADGKTYKVKGTVTDIYNTTYGNWYLVDDTGRLTIYGTLDKDGNEKNFSSLGIENGDVVEVSGPRTTYGSTIELVNVTVLSITKAMVKVLSEEPTLVKEGEEFSVKIAHKGKGAYVTIPEGSEWISYISAEYKAGVASKIVPNPADTTVFTFKAAANEGGDRDGSLQFKSGSSSVSYKVSQKGAIVEATVEEFLSAEESSVQYRVSGVVTKISASSKYHNADITVSSGDFAHSVLLYRAVTAEGNIEDLGIKEGDIVTVVGKRSSYNGTAQMAAGGLCENVKTYAAASVAEFLAAANGEEYAVSGEITKVESLSPKSKYNNVNITIKDGDNTLYLYRVTTFDKSDVAVLNPEVGGTITVAGKRGEYKGDAQMAAGGVVLAYTAPKEDGGEE